jgi:hypothetical protein
MAATSSPEFDQLVITATSSKLMRKEASYLDKEIVLNLVLVNALNLFNFSFFFTDLLL